MVQELVCIGDIAARTQVSVEAGRKKWARLGRYKLQKRLDDAWDAKIADDPYGHLDKVLVDLKRRVWKSSFRGPVLMGDIGTGGSRAGLAEDFVLEEEHLLRDWMFAHYGDILGDLMAVTGNHDISTEHPDTPLSETQPSQLSFDRFQELWGPIYQTLRFGDWTVILLSSDLLLIGDDAPEALHSRRREHIANIRRDLRSAKDQKAILVFHEPQAFRILGDPGSVPDCREDLRAIGELIESKLALTLIAHLEDPKAGRWLRVTWPLLGLLVKTPLAHLLRVVFKSRDCVKIARKATAGNARAVRYWKRFRPFIVPSPKHGYVGLRFMADGHLTVIRYPADQGFRQVITRYL